ncbi:hypothetical protein DLAC_02836 [Tieghemostelium lacteum]|uniref:Uncharacterized protein n=1 Tax=Tieghemostelium lacteum TaxID=361077 RepID=A0A152A3K7_TIELA|nr:hypothetical protein DLAC_02836 [Tieghemostelium lacteum]|eukprot:KYR00789.1 hypothetical protein DLAC_02836 [Tieghemostelium lacteum]
MFIYLQATIQGQSVMIPNVQLQESGFPSFIQIIGPEDNGLVPSITQFSTSFNSQTNTISIQYEIENYSNFIPVNTTVQFIIYSRLSQNQFTVEQYSLSGSFDINLCDYKQFDYTYERLGIYISIPNTLNNFYQFPYVMLVEMDPNQLNFTTNTNTCDFASPRLVDAGIIDLQEYYDCTQNDNNITIYYDITDNLSGFQTLNGYIRLTGMFSGSTWVLFSTIYIRYSRPFQWKFEKW